MLCEPFIQERVVGSQQVNDATVFFDDAVEEQLGLALEALTQLVVPIRVEDAVGRSRRQISQIKQLISEVLHQSIRLRVGQHAPDLPFQHRRSVKLVLARNGNQFVIRNAAPEQEGQAGSQFEIGNAIGPARGYVFRLPLGPHQKLRAGQNSPQCKFDSVLKSSLPTSLLVKALNPFLIHWSDGPPVGTAHQRRQDLLCAWTFLVGTQGAAGINLADARRIFRTRRIERSLDSQETDGRVVFELWDGIVFERLSLELADQIETG